MSNLRVAVSETACNLWCVQSDGIGKNYRRSHHCSNPQYPRTKYPVRNCTRETPILRSQRLSLSNWRLFLQRKVLLIVESFVNMVTKCY